MVNPYADDFLNSVIKRSDSDSIIGIGNLIMVLVIAPFLVVLGNLIRQFSLNVDPYFEDYITLELIMEVICAFVIFRILDSVNKHRKRDRGWGKALVGYASSIGHDTKDLENAMSELSIYTLDRVTKIAKFLFIALMIVNIIMGALFFSITLRDYEVQRYDIYMSLAIYIYLTVTCVFIYREVERHDAAQIRFSEILSEILGEDLNGISPMVTGVKKRDLKMHAIAVILTLGLYAPFFLAFTVHAIKGHITHQWAYEEKLLEAIAKNEGAVDVELVGKKGLVEKYVRRK